MNGQKKTRMKSSHVFVHMENVSFNFYGELQEQGVFELGDRRAHTCDPREVSSWTQDPVQTALEYGDKDLGGVDAKASKNIAMSIVAGYL